jgi:hypothetical protein
MNERIRQIMLESGYAAPELAERAQKLIDLMIKECYIAIENTNTHHAHTTFDMGLIKHTIHKTKQAVKEHFEN